MTSVRVAAVGDVHVGLDSEPVLAPGLVADRADVLLIAGDLTRHGTPAEAEVLAAIVRVHFPGIKEALLAAALTQFYEIREVPGLKKKPSTSEVLDWLRLLLAEDLAPEDLRKDVKNALPRLHGALLKNEQDVQLFERLAFMARGQR